MRGSNPKAAAVTGLVQMLTTEDSLSCYGIFHLEESWIPCDNALIIEREARLHTRGFEREIAIHNSTANVGRLLVNRGLNNTDRCTPRSP